MRVLGMSFSPTLTYIQPTDTLLSLTKEGRGGGGEGKWHRISTGSGKVLQGWVVFVSRGSPWGKWKVTGNIFCPSTMPQCWNAEPQEDLNLTLHWCQNWAGVYKHRWSIFLQCYNGSSFFSLFMPAKCCSIGLERTSVQSRHWWLAPKNMYFRNKTKYSKYLPSCLKLRRKKKG